MSQIICALGTQDRLIARDTTSTYPPEVQALPDVGYVRALATDCVLSVNPGMILVEENSGPPETLDVLAKAQIPSIVLPDGFDGPAIRRKIEVVAGALGVEQKGEALAATGEGAKPDEPARVLFEVSAPGHAVVAGAAQGRRAAAMTQGCQGRVIGPRCGVKAR